jgi:hypothetical protein
MVKQFYEKMPKRGCDEQKFEYPLKIIDMESYLSNKSDLAWRSMLASSKGTTLEDPGRKVSGETNKLYKQILFTDCSQLKQRFEKTFFDHNILCVGSSMSFATIEEAKNLLSMLVNSKRWLLHGSLKYEITQAKGATEQNTSNQAHSRKRSDSFKINQINRHLNDTTSN